MDSNTLKEKQELLQNEIKLFAKQIGLMDGDVEPIYDGVCDTEKYLGLKTKIMWILKEPYDDFNEDGSPYGGGWSIPDLFGDDEHMCKKDGWKQKSWQPIIYAMYGFYNELYWDDMNYIRDQKNMTQILKQIAYINISKMPNRKQSDDGYIVSCYEQWKEILFKQIELYNPDVIIFGNTFKYFRNDLGICNDTNKEPYSDNGITHAYLKENKTQLYLDVYHPAQTQCSREKYVDSIIRAINEFNHQR